MTDRAMTAKIIDGKKIAAQIKHELAQSIQQHRKEGHAPPGLAVILIGDDPASHVYVRNKQNACQEVGVCSFFYPMPSTVDETSVIKLITECNHNPEIHGILLQLPLPSQLDPQRILEAIDPRKDVDGFHPYNLGRLAQRHPLMRPCTPMGIMHLLEHIQYPFKGKHAVVVGASNIVGRPMALELLIAGSTVTICHRFTHDLAHWVKQADLLISAVGKPNLIQGNWIKEHSTLIDVGITRLDNGTLAGDIDFDRAQEKADWITPVPGGVGPLTVAMLLKNTLIAAQLLRTQ